MQGMQTRDVLCHKIRGLGLKEDIAYRLIDTTYKWQKCSGPEWTVKRLKMLKVDYLRFLTGQNPIGTWYKKRKDGSPKGPFGVLWKLPPQTALGVLGMYSTFTSTLITDSQWKKFYSAVISRPNQGEKEKWIEGQISHIMALLLKKHCPHTPHSVEPLDRFVASPSRRAPTGLATRTVPEDQVLVSLRAFQSDYYQGLLKLPCIQQAVGEILLPYLPIGEEDYDYRWGTGAYIGQIGFIQEPGMKLRAVANPHRVVQIALGPLGDQLFAGLKNIISDYTFDQMRGCIKIQKALKEGQRAWSVDLSDATSNFPFTIQINALEQAGIFEKDQVELFRQASRGLWYIRNGDLQKDLGRTWIQWSKGQPLGLYPSFASFALAHHALLYRCWSLRKVYLLQALKGHIDTDYTEEEISNLRKRNLSDSYAILGDDLVILDEILFRFYMDSMKALNVPISLDKTLENATIAEFAGRVITKNQIITIPKYRSSNDNSFVDICRQYGPRVIGILQRRQKQVLKWLAPLPTELGGLGWNPKGLSLDTRLYLAERFVYRESVRKVVYEDQSSRVRRWLNLAAYSTFQKLNTNRTRNRSTVLANVCLSGNHSLTKQNKLRPSFNKQDGYIPLIDPEGFSNPFNWLFTGTTGFRTIPDPPKSISEIPRPLSSEPFYKVHLASNASLKGTNNDVVQGRSTTLHKDEETLRDKIHKATGVTFETEDLSDVESVSTNATIRFQKNMKKDGWIPTGSPTKTTTLQVLERFNPSQESPNNGPSM